jgi:hypothetical protein
MTPTPTPPLALPALPEPALVKFRTDVGFVEGFTATQMNAHATAAILSDRAGRGDAAGWQPIDTAPKDGTHIFACNAARPYDDHTTFNQNPPHVVHWFNDGLYLSATGLNEQIKPYEYTHWKPLGAEPCDTKRLEAEATRYPKTEAQLVCDYCGADRLKQPCGEPHRTNGCRFTGEAS